MCPHCNKIYALYELHRAVVALPHPFCDLFHNLCFPLQLPGSGSRLPYLTLFPKLLVYCFFWPGLLVNCVISPFFHYFLSTYSFISNDIFGLGPYVGCTFKIVLNILFLFPIHSFHSLWGPQGNSELRTLNMTNKPSERVLS